MYFTKSTMPKCYNSGTCRVLAKLLFFFDDYKILITETTIYY